MQNFKVGDWIKSTKYPHLKPIQIESTYESNERKGELGLKSQGTVLYSSEVVHWQPTEDEWCWFWNFNEMPTLEQFSKYHDLDDHLGNYETLTAKLYQFCEPFIGQLPSFLKDNT